MSGLLYRAGYAPVWTTEQDLTAQRDGLIRLCIGSSLIYVDRDLTSANSSWPVLREAVAACRAGDTPRGHQARPANRSLPDARDIADDFTTRQIELSLGGSVHDPSVLSVSEADGTALQLQTPRPTSSSATPT